MKEGSDHLVLKNTIMWPHFGPPLTLTKNKFVPVVKQ